MGCVRDLHFWLQDKRHYGLFTRNYTLCKPSQSQIKSLWDIHNMPTRSKFTFFQVFLNFWSNAPKCCSLGGGGGGMCMLSEICEKRPFQKCMGWVGDHIFEYRGRTFRRFRVFWASACSAHACGTPTHRFSPGCSDILWSWSKVK